MFNFMSCGRCAMLVLAAATLGDAAAMPLRSQGSVRSHFPESWLFSSPLNVQYQQTFKTSRDAAQLSYYLRVFGNEYTLVTESPAQLEPPKPVHETWDIVTVSPAKHLPMKLAPDDLNQITATTLDHYNSVAEDFREGTRDHDVSQNIDALLRHIQGAAPFTVLDFGCGPGRDLQTFTRLGHTAVGLDGSERFAQMAREDSGCEVLQQDFLKLDLPNARFDGIFANAVLFHIPKQELPRVLKQLQDALKPGGVLFSSNPRGDNREGWNGPRYGSYHDLTAWQALLTAAGFVELEHYYRPAGLPREQQPWLASVWRKPAASSGQ